ncbi:MAG: 30S ribosomal protein S19e [Candidatus Helarchaeota archaeon]
MTTVYDIPADAFIEAMAKELKEKHEAVKPPEWSEYVKTGVSKENIPENPDWWYVRGASILRKIYIRPNVGVQHLRNAYGSRYRRNKMPAHFRKGAGKIIRKLLIQMEEAGLVEKSEGKGRRISRNGRSVMDRVAHSVKKSLEKEIPALQKY